MSIEFSGLDELLESLDSIADIDRVKGALGKASALVERDAKIKAQSFGGNGDLSDSIKSTIETDGENIKGVVFTPLEYAPYVEYGTGLFREENPQAGYWVYVKNGDSSKKAMSSKRYTLAEAKRIVALMRAEGLDATYTQGRHPTPYMRPALDENRDQILRILKEGLYND